MWYATYDDYLDACEDWLRGFPKCDCCEEHMPEKFYILPNGDKICQECIKDYKIPIYAPRKCECCGISNEEYDIEFWELEDGLVCEDCLVKYSKEGDNYRDD